ncbi:MAG: Na/Pi cotransporter family protein [gamma proteobacterium symbiont of Lucinoma myriamae]|nr:Na/Pi cotransporter family protein [gamma proteobacterium symbiont of Lucinoma myriamae]MCU7818989.1 Na/Pi cotransporter family protein [gamma proteobacterium symbiont of Lucinoma myriamae]MCU7832907.1 Na/Pi cotransporter family protein [gamma proteobacterium symbiont of Lucinoma myriamae]
MNFLFKTTQRYKLTGLIFLALLFFAWAVTSSAGVPAASASLDETIIDWFQLGMGLFGGLALFLAGLDMLSDGLKKAAGEALKILLSKLTTNRFMGAVTGAFVTGVLNSSSVTTVLVVSFITAGVMSLSQSVGVIMGANIGSTVTAQLLAFNLSAYALLPIAIGFFMTFTAKHEKVKYYGMMLMGLGLVFFGMGLMSDAMTPLRTFEPFIEFLKSMENPMIGVLVGALFTGLVQSSAATIGIAIAMASEGLLSLPAGIALALGANIGTCVTVMFAALGKPVEAVRAAIVHVLFNVMGVLLWILFIPQLAEFAVSISPVAVDVAGQAQVSDVPRQIANANTLFNVINTIIFLGFTGWFAKIATRLAPTPAKKKGVIIETKYIITDAIQTPSLALEQVRMELAHMGGIVNTMLHAVQPAIIEKDRKQIDKIVSMDNKVNILEESILKYLRLLRQEELTDKESADLQTIMTATINLEELADVIKNELCEIAIYYIDGEQKPSEITRELFQNFYQDVCHSVHDAVKAISEDDQQMAEKVINRRADIKSYQDKILTRKSTHLGSEESNYLQKARMEMSLMEKLYRIYSHARSIAKVVLPVTLSRNS